MKSRTRVTPGERHHWWPKSLSKYWINADGVINRIDRHGQVVASSPVKTARIADGHNIRFNSDWDTSFEREFDRPDNAFPDLVDWLSALVLSHGAASRANLSAHVCAPAELQRLSECTVSLVIRSPRFRNQIKEGIEGLRGSVPKSEIDNLVAANMRQRYMELSKTSLTGGKFMLLIGEAGEFIYGDGVYNNLTWNTTNLHNSRLLVPLTPTMAVLGVWPMQYMTEPNLVIRRADETTVALVNEATQVYSSEYLFYRSVAPSLIDAFTGGQLLRYGVGDPIRRLIDEIPGVIRYL